MLEGFGLYPVVLQIDPDSYDGDWRHVARFRNRSGWLLVAEAEIFLTGQHQATKLLIVGCDEWGEPIPSFIAANLLACATSLPQPSDEIPPGELEALIEDEIEEVRKRWLRETNASIALLHAAGERAVRELDGNVEAQLRASDRVISELSRQRRMLPLGDPRRSALTEAISDQEDWQTGMVTWLADRRRDLRIYYETQERKASKGRKPQIVVEPLYVVNWHHAGAPADEVLQAWADATRSARSWYALGYGKPDLSEDQLEELAAISKRARRPDRAVSPAPPKAPGNRLKVDWDALRESLGVPTAALHDETEVAPSPTSPPTSSRPEPVQVKKVAPPPKPQRNKVKPSPTRQPPAANNAEQNRTAAPAQLPLPVFGEDLQAERAKLRAKLNALELRQIKFRAGSPKFIANKVEVGVVSRQLAALERRIGEAGGPLSASTASSAPERTKRDLERERFGYAEEALPQKPVTPPDHKDRIARVLNLEALLERHRQYTGDWFRLNELLAEARAALRRDGKG